MGDTNQKAPKERIAPGYRLGELTVVQATNEKRNGYTVWLCRCSCGGEIRLDTRYMQRRTITDCGCQSKVKPGRRELTGMRFGKLVCVKSVEDCCTGGQTGWLCECDCGNVCIAGTQQLLQGYKKSCGCMSRPPVKAYVGKRFGKLTVTEYAGKVAGMHRWKCLCDCGSETIVGQTLLQTGKTKSCGCLVNPPVKDLTGRKFGRLTVVSYEGNKNRQYFWRCVCECGNETVVRQYNLLAGRTKSCGCLQSSTLTENLQLREGTSVTILEAMKGKLLSNNTSGHTGVYQNKKTEKWHAQITFKRKTYFLGTYTDIADAVKARQRGEKMHNDFLEQYYMEKEKK